MESITTVELTRVLHRLSRSNLISLTAITDPDMNKRDNPFCTKDGRRLESHVRKVSFLAGCLINVSYSKMVSRRRWQEWSSLKPLEPLPDRPTNPRAWGQNEDDCPLVSHVVDGDDRLYLHVVVQRRWDHFFDARTNRQIRGEDLADLQPFLNERDSGYRSQGLRNPVIVKDFMLPNLAELTANKTRYTIAPANAELERYFPRTKPAVPKSRRRVTPSSTKPQRCGGRS